MLILISTWRPTFEAPIMDTPLAFCDGRTVDDDSLVECTHVHPDGPKAYNLYCTYQPQMRWYYLSRQTRNEVTVFKNFDTASVPSRFAPHATFRHRWIPPGCQPRETAETLSIIVTLPSRGR